MAVNAQRYRKELYLCGGTIFFKFTNMKKRIVEFLSTYVLFVVIFLLQKPLFMAYYHTLYAPDSAVDWLRVMGNGLPLDLSLAGYLTILPGFFLIVSAWTNNNILYKLRRFYFLFIAILLSCIFISDLGLYAYWGFRLDSTPLFYFFSSPKDALASVSLWTVLAGVIAWIAYAALLYGLFYIVLLRSKMPLKIPFNRMYVSAVILLLTGLLFIPIRGGFTVSTMNIGKVYFSSEQRLNHAAINPCFSLMESLSKQTDFSKQYRFLPPEEADRLFATMTDQPVTSDSIPELFTTKRPNIILVILEGFSSHLMTTLGGEPDIAVNMDKLGQEGVLFTHFYANSFRTDRGLMSILSGYPAQPTTSIMKFPHKTQSLPSIPNSLQKAGYQTEYYYGGDADFTNMRSFLISAGIEKIVCDKDFPLSERLSKWGAHDHVVFNRLLTDLRERSSQTPFFKILQTSSSHEPFEVPFRRLSEDRPNAFAYADSCLGDFVRQYRQLPEWKNTVMILVPDHQGAYPENLKNESFDRYQIPLIFAGGAIKDTLQVDAYGSQIDIAATLLAQLGLPHDKFTFSKNLLNPDSPHFAYFTFPNLFGMKTVDDEVVFDCESNKVVSHTNPNKEENLLKGKAFLQKLYDDIAKR